MPTAPAPRVQRRAYAQLLTAFEAAWPSVAAAADGAPTTPGAECTARLVVRYSAAAAAAPSAELAEGEADDTRPVPAGVAGMPLYTFEHVFVRSARCACGHAQGSTPSTPSTPSRRMKAVCAAATALLA